MGRTSSFRRMPSTAGEDSEEYDAWVDYLASGGTTKEWEAYGKAEWKKLKYGGFLELNQTTKITKKKGDIMYSSVDADLVNSKKYLRQVRRINYTQSSERSYLPARHAHIGTP